MQMQKLIDGYLEDMKLAWSPNTVRSEKYRLMGVISYLDGNPRSLWKALERTGMAPYARVTTWTRVTAFWDWMLAHGHVTGSNGYREFRKKYARQFKNAYRKSTPAMTFEEAKARIARLRDSDVRSKALELLTSGMRYTESFTLNNGEVVGKGGKRRPVYVQMRATYDKSYSHFWRKLGGVGLKPHDLRKLCMNKLVEAGANTFELTEIAGWNNLNTAASYISGNKKSIRNLMTKVK